MPRRPPIDDDILSELERDDPDLVAKYRERIGSADSEIADAKSARDYGGYADVIGQGVTDFNNSQRKDIILSNSRRNLGEKPAVIGAKRDEWKPVQPLFDKRLAEAQSERGDAFKKLSEESQVGAFQKKQDMDDPASDTSAQYREYLKALSPTASAMPGLDRMSATQMAEFAPGLMKKMEIEASAVNRRDAASATAEERKLKRLEQSERNDGAAADRALKREELRQRSDEKLEEKREQLRVTDLGYAQTPDDAKQLKDSVTSKANFDGKLNELIKLRKKHGGGALLDREDVGRSKQLSKDLLLEYKNLQKLGVLSQADEAIINAIIPSDPLEFRSPWQAVSGQDSILSNMEKFQVDSDKDFQTKLQTRLRREGRNPSVNSPAGKGSVVHGSQLPD